MIHYQSKYNWRQIDVCCSYHVTSAVCFALGPAGLNTPGALSFSSDMINTSLSLQQINDVLFMLNEHIPATRGEQMGTIFVRIKRHDVNRSLVALNTSDLRFGILPLDNLSWIPYVDATICHSTSNSSIRTLSKFRRFSPCNRQKTRTIEVSVDHKSIVSKVPCFNSSK